MKIIIGQMFNLHEKASMAIMIGKKRLRATEDKHGFHVVEIKGRDLHKLRNRIDRELGNEGKANVQRFQGCKASGNNEDVQAGQEGS